MPCFTPFFTLLLFLAFAVPAAPAAPLRTVLNIGHSESIAKMAFHPDERLFLSADTANMVKLWDLRERTLLFSLRLPSKEPMTGLRFTAGNRFVAVFETTLAVVDYLEGGVTEVRCKEAALSDNGAFLAFLKAGGQGGQAERRYTVASLGRGTPERQLTLAQKPDALFLADNGQQIAVARYDKTETDLTFYTWTGAAFAKGANFRIKAASAKPGKAAPEAGPPAAARIAAAAFAPERALLFFPEPGQAVVTHQGRSETLPPLPENSFALLTGGGRSLAVETSPGDGGRHGRQCWREFGAPAEWIADSSGARFLDNGAALLVKGREAEADGADNDFVIASLGASDASAKRTPIPGTKRDVPDWCKSALSPSGRFLAMGDGGNAHTGIYLSYAIRIADMQAATAAPLYADALQLRQAAFTPDNRKLLVFGQTNEPSAAERWSPTPKGYALDAATMRLLFPIPAGDLYVVSRDGKRLYATRGYLARGEGEQTITVANLDTGEIERVLRFAKTGGDGFALAVSPDQKTLAVAYSSENGSDVHWIDAATGKVLAVRSHDDSLYDLLFLDNARLAAVNRDGAALLDPGRGKARPLALTPETTALTPDDTETLGLDMYGQSADGARMLSSLTLLGPSPAAPVAPAKGKTPAPRAPHVQDKSQGQGQDKPQDQRLALIERLRAERFHIPFGKTFSETLTIKALTSDAGVAFADRAGQPVGTLYLARGKPFFITPEGYFSGDPDPASLSFVRGLERFDINRFYDVFYRPDIVQAKLRGEDIAPLISVTLDQALQNPPPSVALPPRPAFAPTASVRTVRLPVTIKANGGGIGEVRVFHNGKLVKSDGFYRQAKTPDQTQSQAQDQTQSQTQVASLNSVNARSLQAGMRAFKVQGALTRVTSPPKPNVHHESVDIEAVPGENEVSVCAFNQDNTVQSMPETMAFTLNAPPEPPRLHLLAVGVNHYKDPAARLGFAVKDAEDITRVVKAGAAPLYGQDGRTEILLDAAAGKEAVFKALDRLAATAKAGDVAVFYFAGHGVLLDEQYYIVTHDYAGKMEAQCLISSNELIEMSKKIKALKQVFLLDTCHAGGVDSVVDGLYDARMSVLAKKLGLHVFSSCSDYQTALDGFQGNGLFTGSLLGAFTDARADGNGDGRVTAVEIGRFAKKETEDKARKAGHAQWPRIIDFGADFGMWVVGR